MSKKKKLPHYSRILPAPTTIVTSVVRWIILITAFYINIQALRSAPFVKVSLPPKENTTSLSYRVLGVTDSTSLEQEYLYWKQIINQKPEFRDGLIQSAILAYKLNHVEEARVYAHKALLLDPNNSTIQSLLTLLKPNE